MNSVKKPQAWFKTVGILGEKFPTKKALVSRIQSVVNAAPIGLALPDADFAFFMGLLPRHHEWVEKAGCGVGSIEVRMNSFHGFSTRGLWLVRRDDTSVDISWWTALDGAQTYEQMLYAAARNATADQCHAVRQFAPRACAVCGEPIFGDMHVDHRPPVTFSALLSNWRSARSQPAAIRDAGITSVFEDPADEKSWSQFHSVFADLAPAHPLCNLKQGVGA